MHVKNLSTLQQSNIHITSIYNTNLDNVNLNNFDVIFSPCSPINVSNYKSSKFIFGPHFSVQDYAILLIRLLNNFILHFYKYKLTM